MRSASHAFDPNRSVRADGVAAPRALRAVGVTFLDTDADLALRVRAEFQEMPDLALTLVEAARFFAVDRSRCGRILDKLVGDGVLSTDGRVYVRAGTGRQHV